MPNDGLQQLCEMWRAREVARLRKRDSRVERVLNAQETAFLAEQILFLPTSYQEVLMARFCYQMSIAETSEAFGISDPETTYDQAQCALGYAFDLANGECIAVKSLHDACVQACDAYIQTVRQQAQTADAPHNSSMAVKQPQKRQTAGRLARLVLKRVAMVTLTMLLGAAMVLSVNASLRERFFQWLISHYEEYSAFGITSEGEGFVLTEPMVLEDITFGYIPEGFLLREELTSKRIARLDFINARQEQITLNISLPGGAKDNLNTEGASLEQVSIQGQPGFFWVNRGTVFVVWEQKGYMLSLIADFDYGTPALNRRTVLAIAKNISLGDSFSEALSQFNP